VSLMHFEPFRAFRDLDRLSNQLLSGTRVPMAMPMDAWQEGQTYHVVLDVPGIDPGSIELHVERNTLTVSAERQAPYAGDGGDAGAAGPAGEGQQGRQVLVAERPMGSFTRQLVLGDGLDTEAIDAEAHDGVLHITIPLAQQARPRRVQVSGGSGGGATGGQPQVVAGETTSGGSGGSSGSSGDGAS
jgi:HSP20 family protein